MKVYRITNRATRETQEVQADNASDACRQCGWLIGSCYVEELTEKRQKALDSVTYASRNLIYAFQDGDTIPGEAEWLEHELERAVRRALNVGCTTDEIAAAQVAAAEEATCGA